MHQHTSTSAFLPLLLSLSSGPLLTAAAGSSWMTPSQRNDSTLAYGRQRVPPSYFDESVRHPNATGRSEFVGRDLSRAYDQEDYEPDDDDDDDDRNEGVLLDGWSLSLNLTNITNISLGEDGRDNRFDVSTFAGLGLSILAPEGMASGSGSSSPSSKARRDDDDDDDDDDDRSAGWTVCATVYGINPGDTANYTQLAQEDGGTCRSYMNDECREAIREAAAESFEDNRTCQYHTIPDVCFGDRNNAPGDPGWNSYENATIQLETRHYRDGKSFFTYSAEPGLNTDDRPETSQTTEEEWDDVAKMAWAVLLTWGYDDRGDEDGKPATSLVCVSASDFAEGVKVPDNTPEEEPENAAPALLGRGRAAFALFAALAAGLAVVV